MHAIVLFFTVIAGQEIVPVPPTFEHVQQKIALLGPMDMGHLMVEVGISMLGTAYEPGTLNRSEIENLEVHFEGMDCFTFVENSFAMAHCFSQQGDYPTFLRQLETIRYREGKREGYASRLHYTSDWAYDNERKGLLRNVTAEIGGGAYRKVLNFMTQHRQAYRQLSHEPNFQQMNALEKRIANRLLYYIPKQKVSSLEQRIRVGDILAITTDIPGLDVVHVGLAIFRMGRLHLLHASSVNQQVEVMAQPLADYLMTASKYSGLMVFRPRGK